MAPVLGMTTGDRRDDAGTPVIRARHGTAGRGYRREANRRLSVRLGPGYALAGTPSGRWGTGYDGSQRLSPERAYKETKKA